MAHHVVWWRWVGVDCTWKGLFRLGGLRVNGYSICVGLRGKIWWRWVGAAPVCPPERPRSGVSIPKTHALCAGIERWMRPCGATRAGTQAPPLPNSTKPRGVPIPHRGYTFDSAGLASATQPTLGNNAREEATPLGVVLFLITHHHHTSSSHSGEWIICE